MAANVKPVPEGCHTLTAHIVVKDASKAIEFYQRAFGAKSHGGIFKTPDGKVMHAELEIGDSRLMLADEFPGMGSGKSPQTLGGTTTTLNIYVEDVDRLFNQAVAAGATVTMPLANQFWGDRYGIVTDPFGHKWSIATHVKDMSPDEMQRAQDEAMANMPQPAAAKKTA